jgi:TonB-linked SusC/RagA family outer membrane protein
LVTYNQSKKEQMMNQIYKTIAIGVLAFPITLCAGAQDKADYPDSIANIVNVAFHKVNKKDLMGGVSSLNMIDLTDKDYSTYSLDNLQANVGGYNGQLWNQGDVLVLVDGVPRDANNVLPTEIEQITFLKSASAIALYGSKGANGVVLITTKRGRNDGLKVSARANATLFVPKRYPKYLGSAEYMTLYDEALENDGKSAVYSDKDIYNYASGKDPYRYPNINFFSNDYLKKTYQRYDGNVEISGGGTFAHFYTNIDLYHLNDLMDFGEGKDNGTTRLNVRGNIDLKLNNWISGWIDADATFYSVRNDNADYWKSSATLRPTSQYPLTPLIPISMVEPNDESSQILINNSNNIIDGKYLLGGTQSIQTNPFASMYAGGHNTYNSRQFQFDGGININLEKVLKGLSFKTMFAIDYATGYTTTIENSYAVYEPSWNDYSGKDLISSLTKYGNDKKTGTQTTSGSSSKQMILFNAQFDYNRQWGPHGLSAILLCNGYQQTISGTYHRVSNANLGLDINYNYLGKYYADFSGAAIHSAKLAEGHREAFSPVGTLAWKINKENFMKRIPWINNLALNLSYGLINEDIDISDYYMYDDVFTATGTWWGWSESANSMQTSDSQRGGNKDLTFIKRKEFRIGLDAQLFDGLLTLNTNFFNICRDGLLTTPNSIYPSYFFTYWPKSSFLPNVNYNNDRKTGIDFTVDLHKKLGEVDLNLGMTGMTFTSRWTKYSENVQYDWLKSKGAYTDAIRGYECLGFFQDDKDVASSAVINSNTKPGDLKYKDQNGDGIIDSKDAVVLGHWSSDFYFGVNFTAKWRNFTLYLNGTGQCGGKAIKNNSYEWVYGDGKYSDVVLGRWTKETAATAVYPRLTTEGSELNFVTSSFWIYSTTAFRINKVQLTYDLPKHIFGNSFIKGLSVYVSGADLLTIAHERKYMETNIDSAPKTRSYNLGVKVNL